MIGDFDVGPSKTLLRRAPSPLSPGNANIHLWYGKLSLVQSSRIDESMAEMNSAISLDPLSPVLVFSLAATPLLAGAPV